MCKLFNNHRKLLSMILAMILVFVTACPVFAEELDTDGLDKDNLLIWGEEEREHKIDALLSKINALAAARKMAELSNKNSLDKTSRLSANSVLAEIDAQTALLEEKLSGLGVTKISPDDVQQMQQLKELVVETSKNDPYSNAGRSAGEPDLEFLATKYSLYRWGGTYDINGQEYDYVAIKVTDNKKGNGLTKLAVKQVLSRKTNTTIEELIEYNCSFGLSQFLGTIPYGWVLEWSLGNVFTVLNSYNPSTSVTLYEGNAGIHMMTLMSVTQMQYIFINTPSTGWVICGSKASDVEFTGSQTLAVKVGSHPHVPSADLPYANSSTGWNIRGYLENYVATGNRMNHYIGSLKINGFDGTYVYFSPVFVVNPTSLG